MIRDKILHIRQMLPEGVQLLCVSKYHTIEDIYEAYKAGERNFGESRVQELLQKHNALPNDIHWHFIGHLQTNKVKQILPFVDLIHGIDSLHLLQEISKQQAQLIASGNTTRNRIKVLLEVKVAQEATKYGFTIAEVKTLFKQLMNGQYSLPHIHIAGLMGMASNTTDTAQIQQEFNQLQQLYKELLVMQTNVKTTDSSIAEPISILSMGMSDDYQIAIACGSNLVRIGSAIFQ